VEAKKATFDPNHRISRENFLLRQQPLVTRGLDRSLKSIEFIILGSGIIPELVLRQFLPNHLTIIDEGTVTKEDVRRYNFTTNDIGKKKTDACKKRLESIYPVEIMVSSEFPDKESKKKNCFVIMGPDYRRGFSIPGSYDNVLAIIAKINPGKIRLGYGKWALISKNLSFPVEKNKLSYAENLLCGSLCIALVLKIMSKNVRQTDKVECFTYDYPKLPSEAVGNFSIIGAGGIGSHLAEMITRCFPSIKLTVFEGDIVQVHNLNRQIYTSSDIGFPKAIGLYKRLSEINSNLRYIHNDWFREESDEKIIQDSTLVLDAVDKHSLKHQINRLCVKHQVPVVFSGATGMQGWVLPVLTPISPCLHEVITFIQEPPGCPIQGVMLSQVIFIAFEQLIAGLNLLYSKILPKLEFVDFLNWTPNSEKIEIVKNNNCLYCRESKKY
jgi:tRNA A37 threonylcarbamoyladenosine dehydratase